MPRTDAYVAGFGAFLPNKPVANDQIETILGELEETSQAVKRRILMNNGIRTRYYAIDPSSGSQSHTNAAMTAEAIRDLSCRSGIDLRLLSCLACGTSSPDQLIPNHASMVQAELGLGPLEIVSTSGVCCSGMSAFKYGYLHVLGGMGDSAIVTGSELASASLRVDRFSTQLRLQRGIQSEGDLATNPRLAFRNEFLRWMLSDGAGAALILAEPLPGNICLRIDWIDILSFAHLSDPCMYAGMIKSEDGSWLWYRNVCDPAMFFGEGILNLSQDVEILRDRLPPLMKEAIRTTRDRRQLKADRIDWFAAHYSSQWFKEPLAQGLAELGIPIAEEKWFSNLATKGNTGAASIYIILDELLGSNRVHRGDRILCIVPESARMTFCFLHFTAV